MKVILFFLLFLTSVYSQQNTLGKDSNEKDKSETTEEHKKDSPLPVITADGVLYGQEIDLSQGVLNVKDVVSNSDKYKGNNIVVEGIISESCRSGGCWIVLKDGDHEIRALTGHKFVLPLDQPLGVRAVVQGEFDVKEITEDQAKHFAEESGDMKKAEEIKGSQIMYRIKATGIKVMN